MPRFWWRGTTNYENRARLTLNSIFVLNQTREEIQKMEKYVCSICGYVYDPTNGDPDNGIKPGTRFEDLPDDWSCPVCGATKDKFEQE
jgi:rubredoxin